MLDNEQTVEQAESSTADTEETLSSDQTSKVADSVENKESEDVREGDSSQTDNMDGASDIEKTSPKIPVENILKKKDRVIEARDKRIKELEADNRRLQNFQPAPAVDPEQFYRDLSAETGGVITPEIMKALTPAISRVANHIVNQQMAPMRGTVAKTQYQMIKKELADDPDLSDFAMIEPELDKLAKQYEMSRPQDLSNREAVKSLAIYARGLTGKKREEDAFERGRQSALKNKQIEGTVNLGDGGTRSTTSSAGITNEDKAYASRHDIDNETARDIRLKKEKSKK